MVIRVDLPMSTVDAVSHLAETENVNKAEALRRMVERGKFIEREAALGHKILVEREGKIVQVTFEDE